MTLDRITWLHISDLHHGQRGEHGRWPQRRDVALKDMRAQAREHGEPDLILFTGDLTYSGSEFQQVNHTLDEIREAVGGDPIVVPVPGNHDLQRPPATNGYARAFGNYLEDAGLRGSLTAHDPDEGNLGFLRGVFAGYQDWWQETIERDWKRRGLVFHPGLLPGDFMLSVEVGRLRLGLAGLNSAFLQLSCGKFREKLAVEIEQLQRPGKLDLPRWANQQHAALLLMHHPPDWLEPRWKQRSLCREIYPSDRFAACLFGHMHEPLSSLETVSGKTRRWLQAASLFGLEHYGEIDQEERRCGYSWGCLERLAGTSSKGRLSVWRRVAAETPGGIVFAPPHGEEESESFDIELRELAGPSVTVPRVQTSAWRELAIGKYSEALTAARTKFDGHDYAAALEAFKGIRASIERVENADADAELARVLARTHVHVSACLLCLQDNDGAAEAAGQVDEALLEDTDRLLLAQVLAQSHEIDRERAGVIIDGIQGEAAEVVRVLIAVERGDIPTEPPTQPFVRLRACMGLIKRGEHTRAASWALPIIEHEHGNGDGNRGLLVVAIDVLLAVLEWSTNEMPSGCTRVTEESGRIIEVLERYLDPMQPYAWAGEVPALTVATWAARFQYLCRDEVRIAKARKDVRKAGGDDSRFDPTALSSAQPSALPDEVRDPGHPWHERIRTIASLAAQGHLDEALADCQSLVEDFPDRMPIEWNAAQLWQVKGDISRAREHAERAFAGFPGHGQAILLGALLIVEGKGAEVWDRLRLRLDGSPDIRARRILAIAASSEPSIDAPAYWEKVLAHEQCTASDEIELAAGLYVANRTQQAAERAWHAFERDAGASLTSMDLARCAVLQLHQPAGSGGTRLRTIAEVLWRRAEEREDATAAQWYVQLRQRAGKPDELPKPDMQTLEMLGAARRVTDEEVWSSGYRMLEVQHRYHRGELPFESLAAELGLTAAELFERLVAYRQPLLTPLNSGITSGEIAGKAVLIGALELLILDELGLLERLDMELGTEGQVVVFVDVDRDITNAPAQLMFAERPHELDRLYVLRDELDRHPAVRGSEDVPDESEAAWSASRGASLSSFAGEAAGAVSPSALVRHLRDSGQLGASQASRILASLLLPDQDPCSTLPGAIALSFPVLLWLDAHGILDATLEAFAGHVWVTPHARAALRHEIDEHERRRRATGRAERIRTWLSDMGRRGRMRTVLRPELTLSPAGSDGSAQVQAWARKALGWRLALEGHPDLWMLGADHVSAEILVRAYPASLIRALAGNRAEFDELRKRVQQIPAREISFVALVRRLAAAQDRSAALLGLGFADAYGPEQLLELAAEFGGLGAAKPRQILDNVTARGRTGAPGWQLARLALGHLFATTIWTAWCDERQAPEREAVTTTLLERAAAIDDNGLPDVQVSLFRWLCVLALLEPTASFVQLAGTDRWQTSPDSLAGCMWTHIGTWLEQNVCRQHLFDLAASDFLVDHEDSVRNDEDIVRAWSLVLIADQTRPSAQWPIVPGSLGEALAVLSSQWRHRPWSLRRLSLARADSSTELSLDELLDLAPAALETGAPQIADDGITCHVPILLDGVLLQDRVPIPEAVLFLRAPLERRKVLAERQIMKHGLDDGRLVAPLRAIAANPDDEAALHEYGRLYVTAPWRRFRIEPASLLSWGAMHHGHLPESIEQLLLVLSESEPLGEGPLADVLTERAQQGIWKDRPDMHDLLLMSCEIMGYPYLPIVWGVDPDAPGAMAAEIEAALERLDDPASLPVARLASDVELCFLAAEVVGEHVREHAARRVVHVLQVTSAPPPEGSLAALEPELLRIAAHTLEGLGVPQEPIHSRLWLTWRLYQWILRQREHMALEQQGPALTRLISAHAGRGPQPLLDLLDPSRFGHGRLSHRLLAVLHALAILRPHVLRRLWTDELETLLGTLARQPPTQEEQEIQALSPRFSCLGWDEMPCTVAELAAQVLDARHLDPEVESAGGDANAAT